MMLTVQTMISSVEADIRNGSSQRRYHGNTTGANKREAAMGQTNTSQANTSGDHSGVALLSQVAVTNPTSTAGRNFTATASPNARAATLRQRRTSAAKDTSSSNAPTISM